MSPQIKKDFNPLPIVLTPEEEEGFKQLITTLTGIVLQDHQLSTLQQTVNNACKQFGYKSANELQLILEQSTKNTPEFEFLLAGITVGESYFFRDTAQITLLREKLLPDLIAQKRINNDYSLRIWSAGCSNGQEIYSIVILLHELLPDISQWTLHFLATDINVDVLANAVSGKYRVWSMRETPQAIIEKYFSCDDEQYQLRLDLCQLVKFSYLNLSEDIYPTLHSGIHAMDIILCRNVFIYLKSTVTQQIMKQFAMCLVPDGLLFLGPSDFVTWDTKTFEFIQNDKSFYFKRKTIQQPIFVEDNKQQVTENPFIKTKEQQPEEDKKTPPTSVYTTESNDYNSDLKNTLRSECWQDALLLVDKQIKTQGDTAELEYIKTSALANLGHLDEALQACQQCLKLNPTDKHTYLLQGTIFIEHAKPIEAEVAFKKAIFLDYAFPEAHYQLGLLQIHKSDYTKGLKSLKHALTHAKNQSPLHKVHNTPGMNYARFIEIINNEIKIYTDMQVKGVKNH